MMSVALIDTLYTDFFSKSNTALLVRIPELGLMENKLDVSESHARKIPENISYLLSFIH